jgi:hypothetical protein
MSDFVDRQAVPISELKNLRNQMNVIKTLTRHEQHILWTCVCMLDDLIESYEKQKESKG